MTLSLKHKFQSAIPDAGDPTVVQPSNWNDEHTLTQATATILGRVTAGTGVTEELTPAQARTLLNVADGATANSSDAFLLARANHTGTESADVLTDGTTNKAFLATERTKLAGIATGATANSTDAFLLARANHTGTQLAATISDFSTAADLRIAAAAATGTGSLVRANNATVSGTFTLGQDPVGALEAATKQYVDNLAAGLDVKPSVRAATTANITLSAPQTIDGVSVIAGDRVLVKDQTTPAQNGIYVVAAGAWTRATDMDAWTEVPGANVWVEEGSTNADKAWVCTANTGGTIGTTAITWSQFGGSGAYQAASANLTSWASITRAAAFDTFANTALLPIANGGTGQTTAAAAFDALAPTTTRGDIIYRGASGNQRLAAGTSGYALIAAGAGADPAWTGFVQPVGSSPSTRTWQSKESDFVSILDYGGIGDGLLASASANATALTNALATGKKVWIPYTAAGYHFGTNQITVSTGQVIEGENQVLLKSTATTSLFYLTGYNTTSGIHNVSIDMTGSGASSTAIRFGTASGVVFRVRISKIRFANCVEAIGDEVHATNYIVDVIIDDCMAWVTRGRQIYIRRSRGFFLIRSTNVDFTQDSAPVAWDGMRFEDFAGLEMERVDVVGWGTGTRAYNSTVYGIYIGGASASQALWLTRVFADSFIGTGIYINNVSFIFANYLETSLVNGLGIILSTVSKGVFSNTLINGATGTTGAAAAAAGLYLDTCSDLAFSGVLAYNCTGAGVNLAVACQRNTFTSVVSSTNAYGIAVQGTSGKNIFSGGSVTGNTTAPVFNNATGSSNVIKDVSGYNGQSSFVTVQGSTVALSNSITTAQAVFASANDTLTVEAATTYRFRGKINLNTGATTHTTSFGFGGTATFTSINFITMASSIAAGSLGTVQIRRATAAALAAVTATSTALNTDIWVEGIMRINAGGTIIPQVSFSAGPTGTCEVALDSFFELQAIGPNTIAAGDGWA